MTAYNWQAFCAMLTINEDGSLASIVPLRHSPRPGLSKEKIERFRHDAAEFWVMTRGAFLPTTGRVVEVKYESGNSGQPRLQAPGNGEGFRPGLTGRE